MKYKASRYGWVNPVPFSMSRQIYEMSVGHFGVAACLYTKDEIWLASFEMALMDEDKKDVEHTVS